MRPPRNILAASWNDGVFVLDDNELTHELANRPVRGMSSDLSGGAFAVVDGRQLFQRSVASGWSQIADSEFDLSVTFAVDDKVYIGTDDARILMLDQQGKLNQIDNFDSIEGRSSWFAGTAIINGKEVGPPLGVRSMSGATGGQLFANVHVGGIPRSSDHGATWAPTIEVDFDAHEVRVSPNNDDLVVAATAVGLCTSHDGGNTWTLDTQGLHAPYCSAVAFGGDSIFVAASEHHFAPAGAIYRRSVSPGPEPLEKVCGGLPDWLAGIADTSCIACNAEDMALISAQGDVCVSADAGRSWRKREETIPGVSSVLIV